MFVKIDTKVSHNGIVTDLYDGAKDTGEFVWRYVAVEKLTNQTIKSYSDKLEKLVLQDIK